MLKRFKSLEVVQICDKMHVIVTITGHVQNMTPVQNSTGFIFRTYHAVVHINKPLH